MGWEGGQAIRGAARVDWEELQLLERKTTVGTAGEEMGRGSSQASDRHPGSGLHSVGDWVSTLAGRKSRLGCIHI